MPNCMQIVVNGWIHSICYIIMLQITNSIGGRECGKQILKYDDGDF